MPEIRVHVTDDKPAFPMLRRITQSSRCQQITHVNRSIKVVID